MELLVIYYTVITMSVYALIVVLVYKMKKDGDFEYLNRVNHFRWDKFKNKEINRNGGRE